MPRASAFWDMPVCPSAPRFSLGPFIFPCQTARIAQGKQLTQGAIGRPQRGSKNIFWEVWGSRACPKVSCVPWNLFLLQRIPPHLQGPRPSTAQIEQDPVSKMSKLRAEIHAEYIGRCSKQGHILQAMAKAIFGARGQILGWALGQSGDSCTPQASPLRPRDNPTDNLKALGTRANPNQSVGAPLETPRTKEQETRTRDQGPGPPRTATMAPRNGAGDCDQGPGRGTVTKKQTALG